MLPFRRPLFAIIPLGCLLLLWLGAGQATVAAHPQDGPTPLQEAMGRLQRGLRGLRKLVDDPAANRAELMTVLRDMETALLAGIAHPPTPRDEVPEGERELWVVAFKSTMTSTLDALLKCQTATLKGDTEALAAAYKTLNENKKRGHDSYQ